MRSTRAGDLLAPFVVVGIVVYVLLRGEYDNLPPLRYLTAVPLVALAVVELVAARRVRGAVRHDPRARPMAAIVIARCLALGKASSLVGSGVVGACVALLAYLLPDAGRVTAHGSDARVGIAVLVAALLLVVAGLALERAAIDPNRDDQQDGAH
ncbi:MAG: DUF3180 domain-containing protein [Jatrophihabitans sp.]|uniref:DUF3180 domain-containing protein n=1 Tax=Jatrophihabitans sp. TaxID=1932789 RepID=UPI003F7D456C